VESFCMEVIYAMKNPTINEFSRFIQISSPNAAYKVNNLIRKGYLKKIQSTKDRREYYLQVTQKYLDYYNVSASYVDTVLMRVKERMSDKEWKDFGHICEIISEEQMKDVPRYKSDRKLPEIGE
jgi:DNA-binding MarR family transcriptional regulator